MCVTSVLKHTCNWLRYLTIKRVTTLEPDFRPYYHWWFQLLQRYACSTLEIKSTRQYVIKTNLSWSTFKVYGSKIYNCYLYGQV